MQQQPSVIATGDFLYFAPAGKAFTLPAPGTVSNVATTGKPDAADPIWTDYSLGSVKQVTTDKRTSKEVKIMAPIPGTGQITTKKILRTQHELTMEAEMNEISRLALSGFYKSDLIELADESFVPLAGPGSLEGWLKRQRYDSNAGLWIVDDWWVDLDVSDFVKTDPNIINPKFLFTWLYAADAGSAI